MKVWLIATESPDASVYGTSPYEHVQALDLDSLSGIVTKTTILASMAVDCSMKVNTPPTPWYVEPVKRGIYDVELAGPPPIPPWPLSPAGDIAKFNLDVQYDGRPRNACPTCGNLTLQPTT